MGVKKKSRSKKAASEPQAPGPSSSSNTSTAMEDVPLTQSGEPLFFIDLLPTKVNPYGVTIQDRADDTRPPVRPPPPQRIPKNLPPWAEPGMNRDARRRLAAIDKYRQEAKRSLRIPAESDETTKELENRVAAWTRSYDAKKLKEADKKHARRRAKADASEARTSREMKKRSRR